ncbi:zinc finger protein 106 [Cheilinus undulatus]|uniref:zinc finger protein 106 n=1 Tax=Cheilinus undulatus TaxID=241271 RepID=UPI001BD6C2E3|nr:zinc finger protein 106 [Cheilinus undulatus]
MEKTPAPITKVGKTPAKRKRNRNNKRKLSYCILCRKAYQTNEALDHSHSMLHHRELETVLGKDVLHNCQACKGSAMGLDEYVQHISTAQHEAKLKSLKGRNAKPIHLGKILGNEKFLYIVEKNKMLKLQEKKEMRKQRKKLKQEAGLKHAEMMQGATGKNKVVSHVAKVENFKQVKTTGALKQMQKPQREGSNNAFFKNRENNPSSCREEASFQNQGDVRDQYTQSIQQMSSKIKTENFQTERLLNRPKHTQGGTTQTQRQKTWPPNSQNGSNYKQCSSGLNSDVTSDRLPQNKVHVFDFTESSGSSQPGHEGSNSAKPSSENSTAPIRDVDISAMLRHIRRELGVREPCRADREARKQNSEASNQMADLSNQRQIGAEKDQPGGGSSRNRITSSQANPSASCSGLHPSNTAPAKSNQNTLRMTQGVAQSSMAAGDSSEVLNCGETNVNITSKAQVVRKATSNLLNLSRTQGKQSWTEMYEETKRKKMERTRGKPRFGIELPNQTDRNHSTQAADNDLPLSEGFHWESFPDSPSAAGWAAPPPPVQQTEVNDHHSETQSDLQVQKRAELPAAAQDNYEMVTVPVKVEQNVEDENGEESISNKRMSTEPDGVSDEQPSRKKKKTKPQKDQDQMDQLLAVSLREEELSHSLQDLDKSLIQARNALQAAYTEVQRLLLMRQQCTVEVNSLRAKRIEILQGMQGVYSGASNSAQKANTFSAGAAAAVQPRLSPLPSSTAFPTSSNQSPRPTTPVSSSGQPNTTHIAMQVKQEKCQLPAVSCNPDTPQVPVNQPVPLFPPNLLPSLLLTPSHLPAPTAAAETLPHVKAESSTSMNSASESPARLQGQVAREEFNDGKQTVNVAGEEEEEEDSDDSTSATLDDNRGNESDNSVEMMEPSDVVVIDIDESDNEEDVPALKEPPQKSVSVEFSSAATQANKKNNVERKVQPNVKEESTPPESAEVSNDEALYLGAFMNHTGPVHGLQVHEGRLYTCSGDNTARAYSLMSRECQAVFEGHKNKINCLLVASFTNMPARLYTGSSDQTIRCYSTKSNKCLEQITLADRVLCLHVAWNILFAGLANGSVASYDLKTLKQLDVFECHGPRGVSCLGTAQEGARRVLLVGSYDSTISVRDAKSGLLLRSLEGHTKTVLCMKVVNDLVFSGSSDTSVHAYNIHTGELIRIYKGHEHAVTSIVILGKVMVTACLDKLIRVYELQSHDRLQVYGGHSDMVMCMAVHKSVIYTGCYDGTVQAVKLNLMKNYRCWWQNCSLIFGMSEHLNQHLLQDHSNPNLRMVKCRWRSCSAVFSTQQVIKQELPEHMKNHAEKDSKVQPCP